MNALPNFSTFLKSTAAPSSPPPSFWPTAESSSFYASPMYYKQQAPQPLLPSFRDSFGSDSCSSSPSSSTCSSPASSWRADYDESAYAYIRPRSQSMQESCVARSPLKHMKRRRVQEASRSVSPLSTGLARKKKYLKESERYEIVSRVLAGEKQAHLAKEFGVSRAAVCYLLKHQLHILCRASQQQQYNHRL